MADEKKYAEFGGRAMLEKVSKIFYDKIYEDAWLQQYFSGVAQDHIERQQVDFMQGVCGGEKVFCGRLPVSAHTHIYITDELFDFRKEVLLASLVEAGANQALRELWLKIDDSFRAKLIKKSVDECFGRYKMEPIISIAPPRKKAA